MEEAEAACGTTPDDMGLARLRAALAEAASVVATAASDDGAAPADFLPCTRVIFLLQLLKLRRRLRGLRRRISLARVIVVGFFLGA